MKNISTSTYYDYIFHTCDVQCLIMLVFVVILTEVVVLKKRLKAPNNMLNQTSYNKTLSR